MKRQTKFESEQEQQRLAEAQAQQTAREFATAEELLRYDAAQTPVPASVEERLRQSTAGLPPPARPWWKRWFKRSA